MNYVFGRILKKKKRKEKDSLVCNLSHKTREFSNYQNLSFEISWI